VGGGGGRVAHTVTWTNRPPWQLADYQLELRELTNSSAFELRSSRIFLEPGAITATGYWFSEYLQGRHPTPEEQQLREQPILTYLATLTAR
ncbi:MAG: hypothetical protein HY300_05250, partial [Verrucomicrobia bacterium]|nr:hypothetical protein [Verrucomicrobiota bacterium]